MGLNRIADSDIDTTAKDMSYCLMLIILALFMVSVVLINPEKKKEEIIGMMQSEISIEMTWPDCPKYPQDIDLWVMGPDRQPVGYSRQKSESLALLRDDLGCDPKTPLNAEYAFSISDKKNLAGHYVVNVHFYMAHGGELNVPVKVEVKLLDRADGKPSGQKTIISREVVLEKVKDEITVVQFDIDGDGNLINGSVTHEFTPLISRRGPI